MTGVIANGTNCSNTENNFNCANPIRHIRRGKREGNQESEPPGIKTDKWGEKN